MKRVPLAMLLSLLFPVRAFKGLLSLESISRGVFSLMTRTDYVILTGSDTEEFEESIFKIFKGINVIEYKKPHDSLNMRTIHKICGYAHMMIGVAEHEGDVPPLMS